MSKYTPRTPKDFRRFLILVFKHLRIKKPTKRQLEIAWFLQHGPKRLVIKAFRGIGKSWITSAFVCWCLDHNPNLNFLVVSAAKDRADDFSTFVHRLIKEMPILEHLAPKADGRDSKISFDVGPAMASHAPSVKSLGIMSQLTGGRADIIIADDIEVPKNSQTQEMRNKLSEQVKEFESIIKPLDSVRIIFLGTPQHEQSVYNQLPSRGYKTIVWTSRVPKTEDMKLYEKVMSPWVLDEIQKGLLKPGDPVDPERFGHEDLLEREGSYGPTGYALQFQLNTALADLDRFPLKINDLVVMDCQTEIAPEHVIWASDPSVVINDLPNVGREGDRFHRPMSFQGTGENGTARFLPYTGSIMTIDPSGRGSDELAYSIVKNLNGQLFVLVCAGLQGGYSDTNLEKLAHEAAVHKVNVVQIESNFGDGMFTKLFQPILFKKHKCLVEEVRHSVQKEKRIVDTLEPIMSRHKLIIDRKVIENDYKSAQVYGSDAALQYQLIYQLSRITRNRKSLRHDDRLDSLAMAVSYWVEQMNVDIEQKKRMEQERLMDEEIKSMLRGPRTNVQTYSFHGITCKSVNSRPRKGNWLKR